MSFSFLKSSPMASSVSTILSKPHSSPASSFNPLFFLDNKCKIGSYRREFCRKCRATKEPSSAYSKEIERLSAKESLLLAFRGAGGFEGLVSGKTTDVQRIEVNEKIVSLERLNPSPRPTTSPCLEGKWKIEWFGSPNLGFLPLPFLLEQRSPLRLSNLSKLDVVIKDTYANAAASLELLNSIEIKIIISSRLYVEGALRMKQEFLEGVLESPKVKKESIPDQLRGAFDQASIGLLELPGPIRDVVAGGLKLPLGVSTERFIMISYLDDEILIIRDIVGVPEVLTRLDAGP